MTKIKPNFYKQIDSRYSKVRGAGTTLGASGCGPTACANVISKTTNASVTPKTTFLWACKNGYMTSNQGLYWAGIAAMLKHWGVKCEQTTDQSKVKNALSKGYWAIAIMGKGLWTRGGHFILLYNYSDGYVDVSDSASYSKERAHAKFSTYAAQNYNHTNWMIIDPTQYKLAKAQLAKADKKAVGKTATLYVSESKGASVRKSPSADSKLIGTAKFNKGFKLKYAGEHWYKITSIGKFKGYYIKSTQLSKYKQQKIKYKFMATMNLRDGYSTKTADVIGTIRKSSTFTSTKQRGTWAYFPIQKGLTKAGWVKIKNGNEAYLKAVK